MASGRVSASIRAPRAVERAALTRLNAELAARGATDVLAVTMSPAVRGDVFVLVVTPDIGEPFELLLPYVVAFPELLATVPPRGTA